MPMKNKNHPMKKHKPLERLTFQMRLIDKSFIEEVDRWRNAQLAPPSRAEAIRQLTLWAIKHYKT